MTVAITAADLRKLQTLATSGLGAMIASFLPGRTGGFLYLQDASGECHFHQLIGTGYHEKLAKWKEFSCEKAHRLAAHPVHRLSWQSRDLDNDQWGGAIRLPNGFILSFSGLLERVDEVFCAALAVRMGWATEAEMRDALSISGSAEELPEILAMIPKDVSRLDSFLNFVRRNKSEIAFVEVRDEKRVLFVSFETYKRNGGLVNQLVCYGTEVDYAVITMSGTERVEIHPPRTRQV